MSSNFPNSIPRPLYIDRVLPFVGKDLIKVFTGQRRVGKSHLLFQLMAIIKEKDSDSNIIYINKEDLAFRTIKNAEDLNKYVIENQSKAHKNYVFIDEIQEIENFEDALRSLLLDTSIDLYCTGSNAQLLSGDIAGRLSGRFIEIQVYSLTYTEFLTFQQLEDTVESLQKYMKYGGLPYLKHIPLKDTHRSTVSSRTVMHFALFPPLE